MRMTTYERARLDEIRRWQETEPGWGTRLLASPSSTAAQAVQALVPIGALRTALEKLNDVALRLSDVTPILQRAGADSLAALRELDLPTLDRVARHEERRAMALAGVGGAAFGVAGAAGMVADVPALLTLALRTIHRSALCYGEAADEPQERRAQAIGIFALASANSMQEKQLALQALRADSDLLDVAWREGVERVAERELAKEAAVFSLQTLSSRIGLHLSKRKVLGTVPVIGAAIGASVNAWYIRDIAQVARYVFSERWLQRRHPGLEPVAAPPAEAPPRRRRKRRSAE